MGAFEKIIKNYYFLKILKNYVKKWGNTYKEYKKALFYIKLHIFIKICFLQNLKNLVENTVLIYKAYLNKILFLIQKEGIS